MRIEPAKEKSFTPYSIVIENKDDEKKLLSVLMSAITLGNEEEYRHALELRNLIKNK